MALSKKSIKALEKLFNPHARGVCPTVLELKKIFDETEGGSYRNDRATTVFNRNGTQIRLNSRESEVKRAAIGEIKKMLADLNPYGQK